MMLIRQESGRTGRVKMSSINFEHISNYNHYFVSVGRKIGRIKFEMQMVFFCSNRYRANWSYRHLNPSWFLSMIPANLHSFASKFFYKFHDLMPLSLKLVQRLVCLIQCYHTVFLCRTLIFFSLTTTSAQRVIADLT